MLLIGWWRSWDIVVWKSSWIIEFLALSSFCCSWYKSDCLCSKSLSHYKCVTQILLPMSSHAAMSDVDLSVYIPCLFIKPLPPLRASPSDMLLTHTPLCSAHPPFFSQRATATALSTSYASPCDVWSPAVPLPLCDYCLSECAVSAGRWWNGISVLRRQRDTLLVE